MLKCVEIHSNIFLSASERSVAELCVRSVTLTHTQHRCLTSGRRLSRSQFIVSTETWFISINPQVAVACKYEFSD